MSRLRSWDHQDWVVFIKSFLKTSDIWLHLGIIPMIKLFSGRWNECQTSCTWKRQHRHLIKLLDETETLFSETNAHDQGKNKYKWRYSDTEPNVSRQDLSPTVLADTLTVSSVSALYGSGSWWIWSLSREHWSSFPINKEQAFELVPFKILWTLVWAKEPARFSTSFEQNHLNQECIAWHTTEVNSSSSELPPGWNPHVHGKFHPEPRTEPCTLKLWGSNSSLSPRTSV